MRTFLLACVATVAISIAAYYGLHNAGFSSQDVNSGSSVRLD